MLGVLEIWNDIKSEALAILAVCLLTTLCTAAATALTVHIVFRLQHRETEEAFDHDWIFSPPRSSGCWFPSVFMRSA